jgi:hypothetical protein
VAILHTQRSSVSLKIKLKICHELVPSFESIKFALPVGSEDLLPSMPTDLADHFRCKVSACRNPGGLTKCVIHREEVLVSGTIDLTQ